MRVALYWHHFTRRPLQITVQAIRTWEFRWSHIYGLQIGPWFVGAIKGKQARELR